MKKRVFSFLMAFILLFNSVPSQAFANVTEDSGTAEFCTTEGCLLKAEAHEECKLSEEDPEPTVYCQTEGCLLKAEAHEECKLPEKELEPTVYCETEGCLLKAEAHEECKLPEKEPEPTVYCETEGCLLKAEAHEECKLTEGEPEPTAYCETEDCLLKAEEHETCKLSEEDPEPTTYCETEGCLLKAEEHDECKLTEEETPELSQQGLDAIAQLEALPSAEELPDDLTPEQVEALKLELEEAMNAYYELGEQDMRIIEQQEQYAAVVLAALALNDALYGYESSVFANYYFRLVSEDGVPVTGASVRVGNRNASDRGNGYYRVNTNSSNLTVTVQATDEYQAVTQTITGSAEQGSQAPVITVPLQATYNVDFRLYYYIGTANTDSALFPDTYGGPGDAGNYGPSRDNTPFMLLTVNVNALRRYVAANPNAMIEYRRSPSNGNQWEFIPENASPTKANTMTFWNTVEGSGAVESGDLTALNDDRIGEAFYGYAMKKQQDGSYHIDGILDVTLPIYIVELYDNSVLFDEFYTDSAQEQPDFVTMDEVLQAFEDRLGADVTWNNQPSVDVVTYTGTYKTGTHLYTVTVTKQDTNRNHGDEVHQHIRYFSQNSADSYYLASFNMTVTSEPLYTVTYQWEVYDISGNPGASLPEGAYGVPSPVTGLASGYDLTVDNTFTSNTSYPDYEQGVLYTFSGWTNYADHSTYAPRPDSTHTAIPESKVLDITENTWINGYWTATPLEPADAHIILKKTITQDPSDTQMTDEDLEYVKNYLKNTNELYIQVETHADKDNDGQTFIDADYGMIVDKEHRVDVFVYGENNRFVFTEKAENADVPGYTRTTTVTVDSDNGLTQLYSAADAKENDNVLEFAQVNGDVVAKVQMTASDSEQKLGTVTFNNQYKKNVGDDVDVQPTLKLYKFATDTNKALAGVTFTLTQTDVAQGTTARVYTATTDQDGIITFENIPDGTYTLKETQTAAGYKLCEHAKDGFTVTVDEADAPVTELRNNAFVKVNYHTISIAQSEACDHVNLFAPRSAANAEDTYIFRVSNEPILGEVEFSKTFVDADNEEIDVNNITIELHLHGPITRNGNVITDMGQEYALTLGFSGNWKNTLRDLPLGEYALHETIYNVHGYTWTGVDFTNTLDTTLTYNDNGVEYKLVKLEQASDGTAPALSIGVTNHYKEWTAGNLDVRKTISGTTQTLPGAVFGLYTDEACASSNLLQQKTTGPAGIARFEGLPFPEPGETSLDFYLKEITAPTGYYKTEQLWKVTTTRTELENGDVDFDTLVYRYEDGEWIEETAMFSHTDEMLTVPNVPVTGRINITKDPRMSTANITGGSVQADWYVKAEVRNSANQLIETVVLNEAGNWTATVDDLPLGTYTVTEVEHYSPGYSLDTTSADNVTTVTVELKDESDGTMEGNEVVIKYADLVNVYKENIHAHENYAQFSILKVDENNNPLANAQFTLKDEAGNATTVYTNDEGKAVFTMLKGTITDDKPKEGKYTLTESKAPAGYVTPGDDVYWTVTVNENDGNFRVELNKENNIFDKIWDWIIGGITGSKNDVNGDLNEDEVLIVRNSKVKYNLTVEKTFNFGNNNTTAPDNTIVKLLVTGPDGYENTVTLNKDNGWKTTLTGLEIGKYRVAETMASIHGYTWQNASIQAKLGTAEIAGASNITSETNVAVTFEVTDQTVGENETGKVQITNGATVDVTVDNAYTQWQSADFYVLKVDEDDPDMLLQNVEFKLYSDESCKEQYDVTNNFTDNNKTDVDGMVHFKDFQTTGTYYLKEVTPNGYHSSNKVWKVEVTADNGAYTLKIDGEEAAYVLVKNDPMRADLTIEKVFSGLANEAHKNDKETVDIRLKVTGPHNYSEEIVLDGEVDTIETAAWTATLKDLRMGEYTVEETSGTIAGYTLNSTTYKVGVQECDGKVTLSNDQDGKITVTNTYTQNIHTIVKPASFEILKVDPDNKGLPGAVFGLFDGENQVYSATSDENGVAKFEGLAIENPTSAEAEVTYTLKEVTAPAGYVPITDEWEVQLGIKDDQTYVELHKEDNHYDTVWEWIVEMIKGGAANENQLVNGRMTITNEPTKLTLTKREAFHLDGKLSSRDAIAELLGSEKLPNRAYEFQISWKAADGTTHNVNRNITPTNGTGSVEIVGVIPYGAHYEVLELTGGTTDYVATHDNGCQGTMGEEASATVINSYVYNRVDPNNPNDELTIKDSGKMVANLKLQKVDSVTGSALKDAEFTLEGIGFDYKETAKSDENGNVVFTVTEPGEYKLTESDAPDGYLGDSKTYTVTVSQGKPYIVEQTVGSETVKVTHIPLEIEEIAGLTQNTDGSYQVKNTPLMDLTIQKEWDDGNYRYRPTSVKVVLQKDGQDYKELTLTAADEWKVVVKDLDSSCTWSVVEKDISDDYVLEEVVRDGNTITVTNKLNIKLVDVSVKKVWKYHSSVPKVKSIKVVLTGKNDDGDTIKETVTLNAANDWKYVWEDLPDTYEWSVDEKNVPMGYRRSVSHSGNDWTITNKAKVVYVGENPYSGDHFNLALWSSVMGLSGMSVLAFLIGMRKKKSGKYQK